MAATWHLFTSDISISTKSYFRPLAMGVHAVRHKLHRVHRGKVLGPLKGRGHRRAVKRHLRVETPGSVGVNPLRIGHLDFQDVS